MSLKPVLIQLDRIAATSSTREKLHLLIEDVRKVKWFEEVLYWAYHPLKQFKVRELPGVFDSNPGTTETIFVRLKEFAELSGVTKNDTIEFAYVANIDIETFEVVNRILKKDLRCGIGAKTVSSLLPNVPYFSPMLCIDDLDKFYKNVKGGVACSVKLDGVRCLATVTKSGVTYHSRKGKEFPNFGLFDEELLQALSSSGKDSLVFDGEVIAKGKSFHNQMKQVRRLKEVDMSNFHFSIFDIASDNDQFQQRYYFLSHLLRSGPSISVSLLPHESAFTREKVLEYLEYFSGRGEEGIVIKDWSSLYQAKRSNSWCKLKKWITADLPVFRAEFGKGKYADVLGKLVCNFNGVEVKVGSGFSDEQRRKYILNHPTMVEVKYKEVTEDGSLREPIFIREREDLI